MFKLNKYTLQNLFYCLILLAFSGCGNLSTIEYTPKLSPEDFLNSQHWVAIQLGSFKFIISQPTSSLIVYFVSLYTLYAAYKFFSYRQQSKLWWSVGLFLTGTGAFLAGTSYQAFGYEIKCAGREFCTWTSWWEVFYLLFSAVGMNAFLVANTYSTTKGNYRNAIRYYALINTVAYTAFLGYGAFAPVQFLVSFEFLVLSSTPAVLFLIVSNALAYFKSRQLGSLYLRNTWLILVGVGLAYTIYAIMGISQMLWQNGIWFTENDVLHTGLIYWVYYLLSKLPNNLQDVRV